MFFLSPWAFAFGLLLLAFGFWLLAFRLSLLAFVLSHFYQRSC
jgi:hypothetical protein